jgi:hypothetical protein
VVIYLPLRRNEGIRIESFKIADRNRTCVYRKELNHTLHGRIAALAGDEPTQLVHRTQGYVWSLKQGLL